MLQDLVPIALFLSIVAVTLGLAKIISERRTHRQLIEAGATRELAEALAAASRRDADLSGALKWGLTLGGVGLALILVQFLPYRPDEPIVLGLILVFGAGGLLAYYAAARRSAGR